MPPDLPGYLFRPVLAKLWQQHQLWDGTYSFMDLVDINTVLDCWEENQRRANEAAEAERDRR